jgi:hypothetical protein
MRAGFVIVSAVLAALWIEGLYGQLGSAEATMRYLTLSLALIAFAVWRMPVRGVERRRLRDRWPRK